MRRPWGLVMTESSKPREKGIVFREERMERDKELQFRYGCFIPSPLQYRGLTRINIKISIPQRTSQATREDRSIR